MEEEVNQEEAAIRAAIFDLNNDPSSRHAKSRLRRLLMQIARVINDHTRTGKLPNDLLFDVLAALNKYFYKHEIAAVLRVKNKDQKPFYGFIVELKENTKLNSVIKQLKRSPGSHPFSFESIGEFLSMVFLDIPSDLVACIQDEKDNPAELQKILYALNLRSEVTIHNVLLETIGLLKDKKVDLKKFGKINRVAEIVEQDYLKNKIAYCQKANRANSAQRAEIVKDVIWHIEKNNTNINARNSDGYTLLHEAVFFGNLELIKYLVEKRGADVTAKSPYGWTAYDYAKRHKVGKDILNYLDQITNKLPMYAAVEKGDVTFFKKALKRDRTRIVQHEGINIVSFINTKMHENNGYFENLRLRKMLRATAGRIKKILLAQAAEEKPFSRELLSQLNQCPSEEIYFALMWYGDNDVRLVDKLKDTNLSEYNNIILQMHRITAEEGPLVRGSLFAEVGLKSEKLRGVPNGRSI